MIKAKVTGRRLCRSHRGGGCHPTVRLPTWTQRPFMPQSNRCDVQLLRSTAPSVRKSVKVVVLSGGYEQTSWTSMTFQDTLQGKRMKALHVTTMLRRHLWSRVSPASSSPAPFVGQPAATAANPAQQDSAVCPAAPVTAPVSSSPPQPAEVNTQPCSFSLTKLACNGVIMLQLNSPFTASPPAQASRPCVSSHQDRATEFCSATVPSCSQLEPKPTTNATEAFRPVEVLKQILQDLETGVLKTPQFCERIIPVQATCKLTRPALQAAAGKLAGWHAKDAVNAAQGKPIKFAVAYKGRGNMSSAKTKDPASSKPSEAHIQDHAGLQTHPLSPAHASKPGQQQGSHSRPALQGSLEQEAEDMAGNAEQHNEGLNKGQSIALVAASVEAAVIAAGGSVIVDLKNPQVVIVLELLPVSLGVFCALSWLPGTMTCQTPRLAVKSLTPVAEPVVSQKRSKRKVEQS